MSCILIRHGRSDDDRRDFYHGLLAKLDAALNGGFMPGHLVYLVSAAGVGKSALALQFAREAAQAGHPAVPQYRLAVHQDIAKSH